MVMYGETLGRWGLVGVLLSLGCSGVSSPPARERGPVSRQDGGATSDTEGGNTSEAPPNTEETAATSTSSDHTSYVRLPHAPTGEPVLPSYWTILRTDQPTVYTAPLDFSGVP
jgi:hypothetical protein